MRSLKRGFFITFEGPEGSGKSTHSNSLCKFLKKLGVDVLHTREPGGTELGERIRKLLLNSKNTYIRPEAEMLLYICCRKQLVEEKIRPALRKGKIVICDRFSDATVCYQGYGLGVDIAMINKLNKFATGNIKPCLTILLDVSSAAGLRRSKKVKGFKDRIEKRPLAFHNRVRKGYLKLAKNDPRRIKVFSAEDNDKKRLQQLIRETVMDKLKNSK